MSDQKITAQDMADARELMRQIARVVVIDASTTTARIDEATTDLAQELARIRADEREACATIADALGCEMGVSKPLIPGAHHVARTIRARGEA